MSRLPLNQTISPGRTASRTAWVRAGRSGYSRASERPGGHWLPPHRGGTGAIDQQLVRHSGRVLSDGPMGLIRRAAQLPHIRKDTDLPAFALHAGQGIQSGIHRIRGGVVAVLHHLDAVPEPYPLAHSRNGIPGQSLSGLFGSHAGFDSHQEPSQGIHGIVPAHGRNPGRIASALPDDDKTGLPFAGDDFLSPGIQLWCLYAVAQHPQPGDLHSGEQVVVPAEDQRTAVCHALGDLQLGCQDILPGAQPLQMGYTHISDDAISGFTTAVRRLMSPRASIPISNTPA